MTKKLERRIERASQDGEDYSDYKFLQATNIEVFRDEGDDKHVLISVRDDESKTIMGTSLHIKDAQVIFSKMLTWDTSVQ